MGIATVLADAARGGDDAQQLAIGQSAAGVQVLASVAVEALGATGLTRGRDT